ncbi:MAG: N-acetylmuramoyl-L-alanine amidase, partial [Salegentibacter sp.]
FPEIVPADFNYEEALKIIGYDTSNLDSAIKAFKIHFIKEDVENPVLNEHQLKILYNLYRKYLY